jgi:hypothetical protein
MKKVYTLILIALAIGFSASAQRAGFRLRFLANSPAGTTSISTASGNGGFTDSTRWFYTTNGGSTWTALSSYGTSALRKIQSSDTLEINGQEIQINANITLPITARIIELVAPRSGRRAFSIESGVTFTMSSTTSIFSVKSNANVLLRLRSINGTTRTRLVLGTVTKAVNGSASDANLTTGAGWKALATSSLAANPSATTVDWGGVTAGSLPAVLVSFDAVKQSTGVAISWKTQQEQNTKVFLIEKSIDGASYKAIGSVPAAGNSSTPLSYSFNDASAVSGIVYYRVRIVDLDGKEGFTPVKAVRASANAVKLGVYPNPAVSVANVVVDNAEQVSFSLNIFNRNGQLVAQQRAAAGTNAVNVDVSRFAAGDYMIDVQFANGNRQSSKLIVAQH